MPTLPAETVEAYAYMAGLTGTVELGGRRYQQAKVARAVAFRESRYKTDAHHHNANGTDDWGLWQINDVNLPAVGLTRATASKLFDPAVNAAAMAKLSKGGTDWSPWKPLDTILLLLATMPDFVPKDTWKDLPGEYADAARAGGKAAGKAAGKALDPITSIGAALGKLVSALLDVGWWKRAGLVVAGLAVLASMFTLLAEDTLLPKNLTQLATKVLMP